MARAWGHMLAVWAVFSPAVMPMDLLPMIVLLPLAWVNAGAILSVSVLLAYGIRFLGAGRPGRCRCGHFPLHTAGGGCGIGRMGAGGFWTDTRAGE